MYVSCLIDKSYKGNSITNQKNLARDLGFIKIKDSRLIWEIEVNEVEYMKMIERPIRGDIHDFKSKKSWTSHPIFKD